MKHEAKKPMSLKQLKKMAYCLDLVSMVIKRDLVHRITGAHEIPKKSCRYEFFRLREKRGISQNRGGMRGPENEIRFPIPIH